LRRASSRARQIAVTAGVSLLLGGAGAAIVVIARRTGSGTFLIYLIGGAFAMVALPLAYSAIYQLFAARTAQTIVETDAPELVRGKRMRLCFRQPGPASFESLRANLVGEESWWTGTGKRRNRHVLQLGTFNLFDSGPFHAPWERTVTVEIPDLPRPSDARHAVTWNLEVWGKVKGRADVQHVFPMTLA
jgi:hypothetical protein